jgi:hypothetical protein
VILDTFFSTLFESGSTDFLSGWTGFCLARLDDSAQFGIIGINVVNLIKEGKIKGRYECFVYPISGTEVTALTWPVEV